MSDQARGGKRAGQPSPRVRKRATATSHSELGEKLIAGVPARIMRPRLVFLCCLVAICAFGLLMVYSASAVEALKEQGSSWYFLFRQAIFMGIGFFGFMLIGSRSIIPWSAFKTHFVNGVWLGVVVLLVVVLVIGAGGESWGASRWLPLGFFNLQPAELAKPAVIVFSAKILSDYYEDTSTDTPSFLIALLTCLAVPAFLIFAEPDLGTTIIIVLTVLSMAYICGISYRLLACLFLVFVFAGIALAFVSPYRFARLMVFLDPWSDPYGDGYQATLAIMAFASGGLFGRGIGNATMKYHYLPEAHNDYILAIIGEELGFVWTLLFVLVFLGMILAGLYIARRAPSLHGQLIASGSSFCLLIQFLINCCGILGLMPMTGKPLPFISYGGSSVLTSLILAGLIFRVSLESNVETVADRRRAGLSVLGALREETVDPDATSTHLGRSTAGPARPRSARRSSPGRAGDLSVYDGGRSRMRARSTQNGSAPHATSGSVHERSSDGGYGRIDLGAGAQERLRPRGATPRVDYRDAGPSSASRRWTEGGIGRGGRQKGSDRYER